jgi:VCBS repeat-containing protein
MLTGERFKKHFPDEDGTNSSPDYGSQPDGANGFPVIDDDVPLSEAALSAVPPTGNGAGAGAFDTDTVTHPGSGLVFVNTYGAGVTTAFHNAVVAAETYLETHFTNSITIHASFDLQAINHAFSGQNSFGGVGATYQQIVSALQTHATSPDDFAAVAKFRSMADPSGGQQFFVPNAQAKMLGLPGTSNGTDDTVILNNYYWNDTSINANPGDAIGVLMHELTEGAMGRIGGQWAMMDLFRYTAQGQLDDTGGQDGKPTYFSINGQNINTGLQFHNPINAQGHDDGFDWADWDQVGQDANAHDPFGPGGPGAGDPGTLSATDLQILDVLGWTEPSPSGIAVSATTAMAVQGGAAIALLAPPATITDTNSSTIASATIHIASSGGSIFPGDELFLNGQQSGTVSGVTLSWNDSTKVLTLTGSAPVATYQTLLGQVSYEFLGTEGTSNHTQHTVTWWVNDGTQNLSTTSLVAIDHAPAAVNDSAVSGVTMNVAAANGVLANDTDQDHDPLTVVAVNGQAANVGHAVVGAKGQLTLNANGSYSYVSDPGTLAGSTDAFTYTASDGNGGTSTATLAITIKPTTRPADFNGDGGSDLFWRNGTTGAFTITNMNGSQTAANAYNNSSVNAAWKLAGTMDFNGDTLADLVWSNPSIGTFTIWDGQLASGNPFANDSLAPNVYVNAVSEGWALQGLGDFNGDGKGDLIWQNGTTFTEWQSTGTSFTPNVFIGGVGAGWTLKGIGDFNGDGKSDLLWNNGTTFTIWDSTGNGFSANSFIGGVSAGWSLAGVGDFNGDLKDDLVWTDGSGAFSVWTGTGSGFTTNAFVGSTGAGWTLAGVGDYAGAGHDDLLFSNASTGAYSVWASNGSGGFTQNAFTGTAPTGSTLAANPLQHITG